MHGSQEREVAMKAMFIGLKEALHLVQKGIRPLPAENVALIDSVDRVAALALHALLDSPSADSCRKDGYAVLSRDVAEATQAKPVRLKLLGSIAAGGDRDIPIGPGEALKVLTGARIPSGADAVVAEEYAKETYHEVLVQAVAKPENISRPGKQLYLPGLLLHQ